MQLHCITLHSYLSNVIVEYLTSNILTQSGSFNSYHVSFEMSLRTDFYLTVHHQCR